MSKEVGDKLDIDPKRGCVFTARDLFQLLSRETHRRLGLLPGTHRFRVDLYTDSDTGALAYMTTELADEDTEP